MKTSEQDRYAVAEKCRAVLAVWTERKKGSELCRELGISQSLLSQWQDRAMWGMLDALEPRGVREGKEGSALPVLVKRLLERKARTRELRGAGRSALSRSGQVRKKAPVESPAVAAVS